MCKKFSIVLSKLNLIIVVHVLFFVIMGCATANDNEKEIDKDVISVLIIGSAEHPGPVLERVLELEKNGILQNVIVRESFPVQIEVTGPRSVIKKIKAMPKKVSPSFK